MSWLDKMNRMDNEPIFKAMVKVYYQFRNSILEVAEQHKLSVWEISLLLELMASDCRETILATIDRFDTQGHQ